MCVQHRGVKKAAAEAEICRTTGGKPNFHLAPIVTDGFQSQRHSTHAITPERRPSMKANKEVSSSFSGTLQQTGQEKYRPSFSQPQSSTENQTCLKGN